MLADVWHHLALVDLLQVAGDGVDHLPWAASATKGTMLRAPLRVGVIHKKGVSQPTLVGQEEHPDPQAAPMEQQQMSLVCGRVIGSEHCLAAWFR